MATEIISQHPKIDIASLALEAQGLADLSFWINEARGLIDYLRTCSKNDPALAKLLEKKDVRYLSPDWNEGQVNGMSYLCMRQYCIAAEIRETAESMMKGARCG